MSSLPITVPEGFTTLVAVGDQVIPEQVIARKDAPKEETVNIMEGLNLSRADAKRAVKKNPGEQIIPGDVIAVKKNFFGKAQATIKSNISGTILRYERDTGNLVVRIDQDTSALELISPVAGTVSLCNNKEIVIETHDAVVAGGVALGATGEGTLFVLQESFTGSDNVLYYLDNRVEEKIVLVKTLTRDMIIKGESIGAAGFVGISITNDDIAYLQQKELTLPVLEISEDIASRIKEWENKKVMIDIPAKAIILR